MNQTLTADPESKKTVKDFPIGSRVKVRPGVRTLPLPDQFEGLVGLVIMHEADQFVVVSFAPGEHSYFLPDELVRGHFERVWVED